GNGFSIGGPGWNRDLRIDRWLVDGFHFAARGGNRVNLRDVPVVVAVAVRGGGDEALAVGRPVIFIDEHVGRGDLAELARGYVNQRQALFGDGFLDDAGLGLLCDQRAGGALRILSKQKRDGLAVRRPAGRCQKAGYVGELARRSASGGAGDVELLLPRLSRVGKKGDLFAVGRPGNPAL